MNYVFAQQFLFICVTTIGSLVAIVGLFFKETMLFSSDNSDKWHNPKRMKIFKIFKWVLGVLFICIAFLYGLVCAYLEYISQDQIYADLYVNIGQPYLINVGGEYKDKFVDNANYGVVAYNPIYPASSEVELHNINTGETTIFYPSFFDYAGFQYWRIANVRSGEYMIKITMDGYQTYNEKITLNKANINDDKEKSAYAWTFTAFLFEDFYDHAVSFDIYLGNVEELTSAPVWGIYSDNITVYPLFYSTVGWDDNGHMPGKFYGYKDIYFISNAMTDTRMETVIVDVT